MGRARLIKVEVNQYAIREALQNMFRDNPALTRSEVTSTSGVYNLTRVMDGHINITSNSWERLHEHYPYEIPPVEYIIPEGCTAITEDGIKLRPEGSNVDAVPLPVEGESTGFKFLRELIGEDEALAKQAIAFVLAEQAK